MISKTQKNFWICYLALPAEIQALAREKYLLWQKDAFTAALHFKCLFGNVWSVRINHNYRALGKRDGNVIVWFWIGTHADYDRLLKLLS